MTRSIGSKPNGSCGTGKRPVHWATKASGRRQSTASVRFLEKGIVAGGGVALLRCLPAIEAVKPTNDDERIGMDIVTRAVESPTRALADNAGVEGSVMVEEVKKRKGNEGYSLVKRFPKLKSLTVDLAYFDTDGLTKSGTGRRKMAEGEIRCPGFRTTAKEDKVPCHKLLRYKLTLGYV